MLKMYFVLVFALANATGAFPALQGTFPALRCVSRPVGAFPVLRCIYRSAGAFPALGRTYNLVIT